MEVDNLCKCYEGFSLNPATNYYINSRNVLGTKPIGIMPVLLATTSLFTRQGLDVPEVVLCLVG